jgi:hypothetical protein
MEDIGFGLTGMAWNRGSRFWLSWIGLNWRTLGLSSLKRLGLAEVGLGLPGLFFTGGPSGDNWQRPHFRSLTKLKNLDKIVMVMMTINAWLP